jgi:hypothetical protein
MCHLLLMFLERAFFSELLLADTVLSTVMHCCVSQANGANGAKWETGRNAEVEAQIAHLRAELLHKEQENARVQMQLEKEKEERERAQRQVLSLSLSLSPPSLSPALPLPPPLFYIYLSLPLSLTPLCPSFSAPPPALTLFLSLLSSPPISLPVGVGGGGGMCL